MTVYYVGVDAGTSRTSLATSTGKRITVESCIGYPKDIVARKKLAGRPYILGQEALKNRLSVDLIYPLAEGVLNKDERAIKGMNLIFKNTMEHLIPDLKEDDLVYAAVGTPAQASIDDNKLLLKVCSGVFNKVLIVSEPFSVSYGLDIFEGLIVDLGAGTVDLCRLRGSLPEPDDQISLTTAGNYLDELITKKLLEAYPGVQVTKNIIKKMKEKHGYATDISREAVFVFTVGGKPSEFNIGHILSSSVSEFVKPICESVQQLVATFDPEFQAVLRNNIIVAGGGSRLRGIDGAIEDSLKEYGGGTARCTEDPEFGGAMGALKMALEMPDDLWEEVN